MCALEVLNMKMNDEVRKIMDERFGHDNLIALGTVYEGVSYVRAVNAYYEDGAFYIVTYALSNKMQHIKENPVVAICGDWFTAHGRGINLGHVLAEENAKTMSQLRTAFAEWYDNGHTNEEDPNTCILKVVLTDAVLFHHGTRYELEF